MICFWILVFVCAVYASQPSLSFTFDQHSCLSRTFVEETKREIVLTMDESSSCPTRNSTFFNAAVGVRPAKQINSIVSNPLNTTSLGTCGSVDDQVTFAMHVSINSSTLKRDSTGEIIWLETSPITTSHVDIESVGIQISSRLANYGLMSIVVLRYNGGYFPIGQTEILSYRTACSSFFRAIDRAIYEEKNKTAYFMSVSIKNVNVGSIDPNTGSAFREVTTFFFANYRTNETFTCEYVESYSPSGICLVPFPNYVLRVGTSVTLSHGTYTSPFPGEITKLEMFDTAFNTTQMMSLFKKGTPNSIAVSVPKWSFKVPKGGGKVALNSIPVYDDELDPLASIKIVPPLDSTKGAIFLFGQRISKPTTILAGDLSNINYIPSNASIYSASLGGMCNTTYDTFNVLVSDRVWPHESIFVGNGTLVSVCIYDIPPVVSPTTRIQTYSSTELRLSVGNFKPRFVALVGQFGQIVSSTYIVDQTVLFNPGQVDTFQFWLEDERGFTSNNATLLVERTSPLVAKDSLIVVSESTSRQFVFVHPNVTDVSGFDFEINLLATEIRGCAVSNVSSASVTIEIEPGVFTHKNASPMTLSNKLASQEVVACFIPFTQNYTGGEFCVYVFVESIQTRGVLASPSHIVLSNEDVTQVARGELHWTDFDEDMHLVGLGLTMSSNIGLFKFDLTSCQTEHLLSDPYFFTLTCPDLVVGCKDLIVVSYPSNINMLLETLDFVPEISITNNTHRFTINMYEVDNRTNYDDVCCQSQLVLVKSSNIQLLTPAIDSSSSSSQTDANLLLISFIAIDGVLLVVSIGVLLLKFVLQTFSGFTNKEQRQVKSNTTSYAKNVASGWMVVLIQGIIFSCVCVSLWLFVTFSSSWTTTFFVTVWTIVVYWLVINLIGCILR